MSNDNLHRPVLIVIAGPNGSGKTSITSRILRHEWMEDAVYINPDIIAQEKFGDWNSYDAVMQSVKYCEALREECLLQRRSHIFETVLSAEDKVDYVIRARRAGFFIRLFFVCTADPTINASRVAGRVMEGGHDVPITKIISRYYKSLANGRILSQVVDRAYFFDNSVDDRDACLLFRLAGGKLVKRYVNEIPQWAKDIYSSIL